MPATFSAAKPGLRRALRYRPRPWAAWPYLLLRRSGSPIVSRPGEQRLCSRVQFFRSRLRFRPRRYPGTRHWSVSGRLRTCLAQQPGSAINRFRHGLTTVLAIKERPGVLVNSRQPGDVITSPCAPRAGDHGTTGQTEVEWEEALLMAWGAEIPIPPGGLLSAQAARARQVA